MMIFLVLAAIDAHMTEGYNYGLGYMSSILKADGNEVRGFSLRNMSEFRFFLEQVKTKKPGVIGFSATTTQFFKLGGIIAEVKKNSNARIVCGGAHTTLVPDSIRDIPELDAIVIGEGEYAFREFVAKLKNKEDFYSLQGFWFRKNGQIIKNPVRAKIENLDSLPYPDKDFVDYQNIIDEEGGQARYIFSRGCPFNCSYCANKALSEQYHDSVDYFRILSPGRAIEQIKRDMKKFSFDFIIFDDDNISLKKAWFYKFFELYSRDIHLPFRCNLRVGTVNEDMMKFLKEAGAENIGIGIEHGNEKFRKAVLKRNMSNRQIIEIFRWCRKYNLTHNDFIMVGFPTETRELFCDTVKLCRKINAKGIASIFYPYPGTELWETCRQNNWLPATPDNFREREQAVVDYPQFSKEEIQLCADVFPFLIRVKCFPLFIPFRVTRVIYRVLNDMFKQLLYFNTCMAGLKTSTSFGAWLIYPSYALLKSIFRS